MKSQKEHSNLMRLSLFAMAIKAKVNKIKVSKDFQIKVSKDFHSVLYNSIIGHRRVFYWAES
jgi:hypothetical protein